MFASRRPLSKIGQIKVLVDLGILSRELMPTPEYWHWNVLIPEALPKEFAQIFEEYGEIRWYGEA